MSRLIRSVYSGGGFLWYCTGLRAKIPSSFESSRSHQGLSVIPKATSGGPCEESAFRVFATYLFMPPLGDGRARGPGDMHQPLESGQGSSPCYPRSDGVRGAKHLDGPHKSQGGERHARARVQTVTCWLGRWSERSGTLPDDRMDFSCTGRGTLVPGRPGGPGRPLASVSCHTLQPQLQHSA